jgi:hypothetical protein
MSTPTPSETPYAKCGCGFETRGFDQERAQDLFENHECPDEPVPTRWYQAVFSVWGALILVVVLVWLPDVIEAWRK